jgi:2-haloacid dehalogenase
MWRDRQIEYTRLVTMSDPNPAGSKYYLPFWELTIRSLRYVCKRMDLNLTEQSEKKLMDQYIRNVRVIEDAFEQIKEASGISNIEEIVTTFVKAEE